MQQVIENNWHRIDRGRQPGRIKFILFNTVFLVFKDEEKIPFIAIKYSETDSMEQEFSNLQRINKLIPDATPRPYFLEKIENYHLLAQDFKPGTNMTNLHFSEELLKITLNTLIKFHKAVNKGNFWFDNQNIDELVIKPISQFLKINPGRLLKSELNELAQLIKRTGKIEILPYIPQHGDFCLVNLIFDYKTNRIYIIDWEDFGKSYLPLYDLFLLIISYYLVPEKFPELLGENHVNNVLTKCLSTYMKQFGIDARWVRILFPISLITFFNQNYPLRAETSKNIKQLITFYFENKNRIVFNRLF